MGKLKVGILGATGMVGQRFITLLSNHPWFEVAAIAASPSSRGKMYKEAVKDRWQMTSPIPKTIASLVLFGVEQDIDVIVNNVDLVFSALNLPKETIKTIEELYASRGIPVISTNSAHRWTKDVPMIIPEVNPDHIKLIDIQKKNRGWKKGFIAVKPNCSIQTYVPILTALLKFKPNNIEVVSLQAISGSGKTFTTWPEMIDNIIPLIEGEEEKSETEPLKIWGTFKKNGIQFANAPTISVTCVRVPVSDGHMARVLVSFGKTPTKEQILNAIRTYKNAISSLNLPSSPKNFIHYFEETNRPQTKLDRDFQNGMGITMGRLQQDKHFDYKFIALSHNTIRGAAGGAILTAELLKSKGYIG